jgi:hypothetical protein
MNSTRAATPCHTERVDLVKILAFPRLHRNRPSGWWIIGGGFAPHGCKLPSMPRGVPSGLIFRCECQSEWTWKAN